MKLERIRRTESVEVKRPTGLSAPKAIFAGALLGSGVFGCSTVGNVPGNKPKTELCSRNRMPSTLPSQLVCGDGTEKNHFIVVSDPRRSHDGRGRTPLEIPFILKLEGNSIYFDVKVLAGQLGAESRSALVTELRTVIRKAAEHYLEEKGIKTGGKVYVDMRGAISNAINSICVKSEDICNYLDNQYYELKRTTKTRMAPAKDIWD